MWLLPKAKINATANTESTETQWSRRPVLISELKDGKYAYVAVFTDVNGNRVDGGQVAFSTSSNLTDWSGKPNEDDVATWLRAVTSDCTLFDDVRFYRSWIRRFLKSEYRIVEGERRCQVRDDQGL